MADDLRDIEDIVRPLLTTDPEGLHRRMGPSTHGAKTWELPPCSNSATYCFLNTSN